MLIEQLLLNKKFFEEFALGGRKYCKRTTATYVIVKFRDGRETAIIG